MKSGNRVLVIKKILYFVVFSFFMSLSLSCSDDPDEGYKAPAYGNPMEYLYEFNGFSVASRFWYNGMSWNEVVTYKLKDGSEKKSIVNYVIWAEYYYKDFEYKVHDRVCYYVYRNRERMKNIALMLPYRTEYPSKTIDYFDIDLVYTPTEEVVNLYQFRDLSAKDGGNDGLNNNVLVTMNREGELLDVAQSCDPIVSCDTLVVPGYENYYWECEHGKMRFPIVRTAGGNEQLLCIGNISGKFPRLPLVFDDDPEIISTELLNITSEGSFAEEYFPPEFIVEWGLYFNDYKNPRFDELIKDVDEGLEWLRIKEK